MKQGLNCSLLIWEVVLGSIKEMRGKKSVSRVSIAFCHFGKQGLNSNGDLCKNTYWTRITVVFKCWCVNFPSFYLEPVVVGEVSTRSAENYLGKGLISLLDILNHSCRWLQVGWADPGHGGNSVHYIVSRLLCIMPHIIAISVHIFHAGLRNLKEKIIHDRPWHTL